MSTPEYGDIQPSSTDKISSREVMAVPMAACHLSLVEERERRPCKTGSLGEVMAVSMAVRLTDVRPSEV